MVNRRKADRVLSRAEAVALRVKLADWAGRAVAWVDATGTPNDSDALARWLTALLIERSNASLLDESDNDEALALAEREHRLAVALTGLDLGEFTDDEHARLLALLPTLPAEFSPLAAMIEHSLNTASPDA